MRKRPPRAPPNGPDCSIPKRGCQAKKKKIVVVGTLARFLPGRFHAKRSNPVTVDTFSRKKFTFWKVGTVYTPNRRILI